MTAEKIAEIFGVTKVAAYGLLHFMAEAKIINTSSGTREKGRRGRAPIIYHMDDKAFEICAEAFRVHMVKERAKELEELICPNWDAGVNCDCNYCAHVRAYVAPLTEKSELPGEVHDAPVEAAKLLSSTALHEAAKEGRALGTCSGD